MRFLRRINRNVSLKTALPGVPLEHGKKGRLRYLDRAHHLHSFLPLFLFFKQLPFSGYIPPVQLFRYILPKRRDGLSDPSEKARWSLGQ